jgi:hypothetical protein
MPQTCVDTVGDSPKTVCKQTKAMFRYLAEPFGRDDKISVIISRAARRVSFGYWRAYEIWYGRAKLTVEERDAITAAASAKRKEEARNEYQELKTRLARLESLLVQTDAEFHRETISALRGAVRGRG